MRIVHVLERGVALCGFQDGRVPKEWPEGHVWLGFHPVFPMPGIRRELAEKDAQPCEACFAEVERRHKK